MSSGSTIRRVGSALGTLLIVRRPCLRPQLALARPRLSRWRCARPIAVRTLPPRRLGYDTGTSTTLSIASKRITQRAITRSAYHKQSTLGSGVARGPVWVLLFLGYCTDRSSWHL